MASILSRLGHKANTTTTTTTMTAAVRHSLVQSAVLSSAIVVEKAASANSDQLEVIKAVFPGEGHAPMTKMAALARVLATAELVEDPAN